MDIDTALKIIDKRLPAVPALCKVRDSDYDLPEAILEMREEIDRLHGLADLQESNEALACGVEDIHGQIKDLSPSMGMEELFEKLGTIADKLWSLI